MLAAIRPIYFSQGDHSITAIPRNCELRAYVCVCTRERARARDYGFCVRNDDHYVYRIRVMERTAARNAFDYVRQGRLRMTAAINVAAMSVKCKMAFS